MSICSSNKTPETVVPVVVMRRWRRVAVGLLVCTVLTSVAALYCRAEWLQAARERNTQRDLAHAAEVSAEYWFQKYRTREWTRPGASERDVVAEMAARHRELSRKVEKRQHK